jgi:hypothetical protein
MDRDGVMLADVALAQTVPITFACGSDDVMAQEIDAIDVPYGQFVGGGPTSRDLEGSWHADLRRRNLPAQ